MKMPEEALPEETLPGKGAAEKITLPKESPAGQKALPENKAAGKSAAESSKLPQRHFRRSGRKSEKRKADEAEKAAGRKNAS